MKEGWEYKKLGEICNIYQPKTISTKELVEEGKYFVYGANGIIGKYNSYNHEGSEVLMTCRGATCGTINVSKPYSWINGNAMVVHPLSSKLSSSFLVYLLKGMDLSDVITGAAQPQITRQSLAPKKISIPPLSEQQHIVEELDLLSSIIEKKKAQLNELDNLAQSLFYEMFGDPITNERKWNTLPLGQLSNMVRGPFGSALKKEFFVPQSKDTYKVYEQKHAIQKDDKIGDYYISKEKFEELRRFEVFSGDIIMSCSGTIGEFFEIPQGACRGVMNQALLKFKLNEALINKDYFLFVMQYVKKNFTVHGSGLQNIGSVKVIKSVRIGVPSLDLQSCFSQRLRAINETKILIKKSIEEVETLFNSRMDYYFN